MRKIQFIIVLLFLAFTSCYGSVKLTEADKKVTLSNGIIEFSFDKNNAALTSIKQKGGANLLGGNGSGYLMGPGFSMKPSSYKVVRNTSNLVEISFTHEAKNGYFFELHYVLLADMSGIYSFLEQYHHTGSPDGGFGQIRWGLRADSTLFDYHLVRDSIQGRMPQVSEFKKKMQDWTYQLADSSYYTKYDYADYIEGRHVHGFAGTKSGKGIFVIQASHEYLNGGPTKQFNTVHTSPFMIMMFQCDHFMLDKKTDEGPISGEWQKLGGPFFLYVNSGKNVAAIWEDAKQKANEEVTKWPYAWMNHPDYPLQRGKVTGQLKVKGASAANAHIILAAPGVDWQAQSHGYIFSGRADENGNFTISNIRPGNYTLYAYTDNVTEEYSKNNLEIKANQCLKLDQVEWIPKQSGNKLWQIGIADRTTRGFKLSDHKRYYGLFNEVPANLTFTIGKSIESNDWYYAQTKAGSWNVDFVLDELMTGECQLTFGIAGCAKNPRLEILVNDTPVGAYYFGNDHTIYRSSILGGYYQQQEVQFASGLLKQGLNRITFRLPNVKNGGGIMYDVVKLEVKE
ncbi:MAG: polysaccharide lyase family protein [Paludibacter sp.]|nr:polysaccharide lyase family protein [Paludibacter sp.]